MNILEKASTVRKFLALCKSPSCPPTGLYTQTMLLFNVRLQSSMLQKDSNSLTKAIGTFYTQFPDLHYVILIFSMFQTSLIPIFLFWDSISNFFFLCSIFFFFYLSRISSNKRRASNKRRTFGYPHWNKRLPLISASHLVSTATLNAALVRIVTIFY